ncbi:MAG: winged helix-turn-helix transcriptional regulator [Candidatus Marinimicrobia bacterium]|nr:winged helix-turn-helix transcriptional regulator [Candidatus Neomarinimicrobiota bacterium]
MKNKKEYSETSQLNLRSLVIFSRASQTVHRQEVQTIRASGLTVSQFGVLEALYHKGPLRISVVMEKILSTGGNMTVVINNLLKNGLIAKYSDPQDSRANIVELTPAGKGMMEKYFPDHVKNIDGIFSVLSEEEKKEMIRLLKKLARV